MQPQGDVGILGCIGRCGLERDLVEGELLGALAGDCFELDGLLVQVLLRQRVHVVARCGAVEHVALQHGVVADALHLDASAGADAHVELQVLAELGAFGVFEQRLQCVQDLVSVELIGRSRVVMRDWDVGRLMGADRDRDADDLGAHIVEVVGLGVEGEELGLAQALDPDVELGAAEDGLVVGRRLGVVGEALLVRVGPASRLPHRGIVSARIGPGVQGRQ